MSMTVPRGRHAQSRQRDEVSVTDVLRAVPEQDIAAPVPTFTPRELAQTGPLQVLAAPREAPVFTEDHPLKRALADLQNLDFAALDEAKATPGLTYAEAVERKTGYPEGVVRGMLISALWDAHRWYADLDGEACDDCGAGWLCDRHIGYLALARTYETLHDFAASVLTDATALEHVAGACRAGAASASDLGSPGSPLAVVLEAALAGAEAGAR